MGAALQAVESKPVKGDALQVGYALALTAIFNDPERAAAGLKLAITHVAGFHVPVDEQEAAVLGTLQARLKELGACKGAWKKDA